MRKTKKKTFSSRILNQQIISRKCNAKFFPNTRELPTKWC